MTMTFFGQDGTKNGEFRIARIAAIAIISLFSASALAGGYSGGNWAETTAMPTAFSNATYGFDAGANTPPTISQNAQEASTVLLAPGQVSYSVISQPIFRVRQDLSMEMTQWYAFTIVPSTESVGPYVNLKEGDFYKIRAVVVRPGGEYLHETNHMPSAEERYLTSFKMLGRYVNGAIRVSMPLTFPDMQWTWVRSNLYFSITPIDQSQITSTNGKIDVYTSKILNDKTYEIPGRMQPVSLPVFFIPQKMQDNRPTSGANIDPSLAPNSEPEIAGDLDGYVSRALALRGEINEGSSLNVTPEQYKDVAHLKMMDVQSSELDASLNWMRMQLPPVAANLNRQELNNLVQLTDSYTQPMPDRMDYTLARALCVQVLKLQELPDNQMMSWGVPWVRNCTFYPYYYLSLHKNIHVKSLNSYKSSGTPDVKRPFQVISNLAFNKARSTDMSASLAFSPSGLLPNSYGGSLSFGVGESISVSITQNGVAQSFMAVTMEPIVTKLPINRYKTCVAVEIDKAKFNLPMKSRGLYFCSDEQQNLNFRERFYFTWQDTSTQEQASQQAFHSVFRGDRDANNFLQMVNNYTTVLADNASQNSPMVVGDVFSNAGDTYRDAYRRGMPGPMAGVISLPMVPTKAIQQIQSPDELRKPRWYQQLFSLMSYDNK